MENREVHIYEWQKLKGATHYDKVCIGTGIFHQFGQDYEEFETGPGNYSTAIVEMPDGSIQNIHVELVMFIN